MVGRAARVLLRGLVVVLLVVAGALVPVGAASAHTSLVSAVPGDGEVVAAPPSQLVLTFDDDVVELGAEAVVTGPDGGAVPVEGVAVEGPAVTFSLAAAGPAGTYTAAWRVTSADGHPVEGQLSYDAEAAATGPAAPPTEAPAEPGGTDPGTSEPAEPSEPVAEPEMTTMGDGQEQPVDPLEALAPTGGSGPLAWLLAGLAAAGAAVAVVARYRRR